MKMKFEVRFLYVTCFALNDAEKAKISYFCITTCTGMFLRTKIFVVSLALIFANVSSQPYHGSSHVQINAQIGSRVDLSCSFATHDRGSIAWRVDGELIAFGTTKMTRNPRIHLTGHGAITIQPVEREDIRTYVCSSGDTNEQKFVLRQEVYPTARPRPNPNPNPIPNPSPSPYREARDNCRLADRLESKMDVLTQHVQIMSQQLHTMETKFEYFVRSGRTPETRELPRTTPTSLPAPKATYRPHGKKDYGTPEASAKYVDGKRVREYVWAIDKFDDEYLRAQYDGDHNLRTNFLTGLPGYNMSVRLYPNRERYGYLALYAEPASGAYDHLMPWPFRMNYELAVVSHYSGVNDIVAGTIRPLEGKCPSEAFSRRHTSSGGVACGYSRFMTANEYRDRKYAYLNNGKLHVRVRLSDPQ